MGFMYYLVFPIGCIWLNCFLVGACVVGRGYMEKYKNFMVWLADKRIICVSAPTGKVTNKTAFKYASHWLKVQKGIEGVSIVAVEGFICI